jgi:lysyl-tRNA synthetase class I
VRPAGARPCGKKSVRFVEHDGRPRAIEFTCSCGETTLVELVFEEQSTIRKVGVPS